MAASARCANRCETRIDSEDKRLRTLGERIVKAMQVYRLKYELETREADASVDAAGEYRAMLTRLLADDLPRFEDQFKSLLNENTIREVANFQSQLHRERETIRERIEIINRSLRGIDYNPGRYILLEAAPSSDPEIRDFIAAFAPAPKARWPALTKRVTRKKSSFR